MGIVMVEFTGDADTAVFADFARRMGGQVDFRFGVHGFDSVGFVGEKLCSDNQGTAAIKENFAENRIPKKAGGFIKKHFKKHRK